MNVSGWENDLLPGLRGPPMRQLFMSGCPMKVVIFGAAGATGRALVSQALAREHRVIAFVRSPSKLSLT